MKTILNNYDRIKLVLFILLAASLPYYLFLNSILIIAAFLLTLIKLFYLKGISNFQFNRLSLVLLVYYVIEIISLSYTQKENLNVGFFNLEKHLGLIAIPFIFHDFNSTKRSKEIVQWTFVMASLIASLICIVVNINISIHKYNLYFYDWQFSHLRLAEPIGMHPVYFSLYMCFSALIIIHFFKNNFYQLSLLKKIIFLLLIFYFFFIIVMLGGRMLTVAIVAILVGGLTLYGIIRKSYQLFFYACLLIISMVIFIFLNPIVKTRFMDMANTKYETTNYGSYFARTLLWVPGTEIIRNNMFIGVGIGDAQKELDEKFTQYNYLEGIGMDMHNQYLQILLEVGIVGLLIYLIMLYIQFRNGFQRRNLLYVSFLLLFIIGSIGESMFCRQNGIVFFLFFSFIFYEPDLQVYTDE